ncbi:MAG: TSUP family transporter [Gammaproteobacteria bacterium]|nr:TSUP family transporter [Gammaproteobacteria bacterium]
MSTDLLLVVLAAFGAGLVDAMVGGGGLIQLPALLTAYPSTPPAVPLGTNKFASIFGTGSAVLRFARRMRIPWKMLLPLLPVVFLGALGGAGVATLVPPTVFRPLVPIMLAVVLVYMLWHKDLGTTHAPLAVTRKQTLAAAVLLGAVGFYDGFFGPGTGSFFMVLLIRLYGFDFLHSAASARVLNLATNAGALVWFGSQLELLWLVAILMAVANVSGAVVGTGLALKYGSGFVRRIFVAVVLVLIARTAWQAYFTA